MDKGGAAAPGIQWVFPVMSATSGDADDIVAVVESGEVSASLDPVHRLWRVSWDPGSSDEFSLTNPDQKPLPAVHRSHADTSDELGDEEYEALIMIHPKGVRNAMTWTDRVTLDLDPDSSTP